MKRRQKDEKVPIMDGPLLKTGVIGKIRKNMAETSPGNP